MKLHRNPLYGAIRYSLGAGALAGMAMTAAPALAQDDEDDAALERIQVTGSRIQSEVVTAAAPVAEIDAEEFDVTGTTRVEDLLNQYPQLSAIGANTAFTVNPTAGFPTANLRDLGSQRTLVLVNGHRLPPGGIRSQSRDLNTIPTSLIKRVEILSGGASAVYGSDAMAGVVNFILDTDFTGFSASAGYAAFQHDNDNDYMQGLQEDAGFDFPSGSTGLDGEARFADLVYGSYFDGGRGHAMGWVTYRDHEELLAGERDYLSCALNPDAASCGGSTTAAEPTFNIVDADLTLAPNNFNAVQDEDGNWSPGFNVYNFAPINHLQRPDETWTAGASLKYEINEHARPYMDFMLADYSTAAQIAESGTFFAHAPVVLDCSSPLLGSACADLGLNASEPVEVYVGKRNVEGGPRKSTINATNWRVVTGIEGDISANWAYDASFLFATNRSQEISENDFLGPNVFAALNNCTDPDLVDTPACYNAWVPGGVTEEAAGQLAGTGVRTGDNTLMVGNAFVTGDLGFGLPSAGGDTVKMVVGGEWRHERYERISDTNWELGNFLGGGGPRPPNAGTIEVTEGFVETAVPVLADMGVLDYLGLDLAYRISDYDTSGIAHTWKIGAHANFANVVRLRGGWNRAIRSPNTGELFAQQQIALYSAGGDPCAGPEPELTQEQCANTGVSAEQYGNVPANPASQYNQFTGGNPNLDPEEADTYTFGVVLTPIDGLELAVDYWDIRMTNRIGGIGPGTVVRFCGLTGDPFLCDKVNRHSVRGDLYIGSNPDSSGFVEDLLDNFGDLNFNGIDLNARYRFNLLGGMMTTSLVGTYWLEQEIAPLPGVNDEATFDCAGRINGACGNVPEWRHIAGVSYARDWWSVTARWRYSHKMDYKETDGSLGGVDEMLIGTGHKLGSVSFFDLTGSFRIGEHTDLTVGVNNILDREPAIVGGDLQTGTLNSLGGYDQAGRYIHSRVTFNF